MSKPASVVCAAIAFGATAVVSGPAQAEPDQLRRSYEVSHLPTFGGSTTSGNSIDRHGTVAGFAYLDGNEAMHATVWRDGELEDLGTLGGPNSGVLWPVKSNKLIVGVSETAEDNPLGENWSCSAFFPGEPTKKTCVGFVAGEDGVMQELPTLGGHNGFAAGANHRGHVVGWAENLVVDDSCVSPQVLQFRGVVWGPGEEIQELMPFGDDSVSAATAINNRGQVVGISGICDQAVGRFSANHAVLWDDGEVIHIGNLGGEAWHTPMAINNRGEVVGFSNPTGVEGGSFRPHAFRWSETEGIVDLGTLTGDTTSQALGINRRGQTVGMSCGAAGCRAVLWTKDDVPVDLNLLVGGGDEGVLTAANDLNHRGEITGTAADAAGDTVPFHAVRIRGRSLD